MQESSDVLSRRKSLTRYTADLDVTRLYLRKIISNEP